jgi:hypothetical protein
MLTLHAELTIDETKIRNLAQGVNAKVDVPYVPEAVETLATDKAVSTVLALAESELPKLADGLSAVLSQYGDLKVYVTKK